ncbi:MAG: metallophosphoesterase [Elusimicrobia bacterium]|nr:metallophosphoesterase [Elusimicrobiota bacterium]
MDRFRYCAAALLMTLLCLAALRVLASGIGTISASFDGARSGEVLSEPPAPPSPQAQEIAGQALAELRAASLRWSNAAQMSRIGTAAGRFRFTLLGDSEPGRFPWQKMLPPDSKAYIKLMRNMHALEPNLIFRLGDFVSHGTESNYAKELRFLDREVRIPLFTVIGNHDRSRPNGPAEKTLYHALFGPGDFYFDYGGWRLIAVDSADRELRSDQLSWLSLLLQHPGPKMIFTHVPPQYLKGKMDGCPAGIHSEAVDPQAGYWKDFRTGFFEKGSREFEALVSNPSHGVRRVYAGHIHALGLAEHRGVRYVITGAGGSPLYPMPGGYPQCRVTHFIEVSVSGERVSETVQTLEGLRRPL